MWDDGMDFGACAVDTCAADTDWEQDHITWTTKQAKIAGGNKKDQESEIVILWN